MKNATQSAIKNTTDKSPSWLSRHSDIAMAAFVFGILIVLFAPIPSALLDFLILTNFSCAFLILLLTFYVARPVEFSTFPSLLLIATLFRLALNVAATRLILSEGDAGKVIAAIGSYVVGGNYVIGLIVFLILIVVQYVVITSGAQRVSEVAARFTLDGMPGQQMSIDADLNMGFIDQSEAQQRRKNLEKEATFYGAMDGASKFVKGDAIAGIVIMLINIVGGLAIGIMQHGMQWDQALQTYTLLTIGDGIVTQVPALVIAMGTGIIVTRSAADNNLSQQALRQITSFPKTLLLLTIVLFGLLFLPGIPLWPALSLTLVAAGAAWWAYRSSANNKDAEHDMSTQTEMEKAAQDDPYASLAVDPIEVKIGQQWAALASQADGLFMQRIAVFRKQQAQELGMVMPRVRFNHTAKLDIDRYEIHIDGALIARGEARFDRLLAIHPHGDMHAISGDATRDPTYGLPALWIDERQREAALAANYTLVDAATVLMTHLTETLRREAAALLTRAEADRLLTRVRQTQPSLIEELIPTVLSVSDIQKVLQNLLREKVSIRNLEAILETLIDAARVNKDPGYLTEMARHRLGQAICQSLLGDAGALHVMTIEPNLESQFIQSVRSGNGQQQALSLSLEPKLIEQFVTKLAQQAERMMKSNLLPVLLCSPEVRRQIRALSERLLPHLRILSMAEIPQSIELKSYGAVGL